jgi:hypothetical protein
MQQQNLVVDSRPGHNDADRCADAELMAGNRIRRTQALHQALRQELGALRKLGTVLDDGELVASSAVVIAMHPKPNPRHPAERSASSCSVVVCSSVETRA